MINKLAQEIHENAKSKGFYEDGDKKNTGEMLMLIVSEVSEALEADRKGIRSLVNAADVNNWDDDEAFKTHFIRTIKDSFEDEMADTVIRALDLCAYKGIDIESHIKAKMRYNSLREHKHGKKY